MVYLQGGYSNFLNKFFVFFVICMFFLIVFSMLTKHESGDRLVMMMSDASILDGCGADVVHRYNNDKKMIGSYRVLRKVSMKSWSDKVARACIQKFINSGWVGMNNVYCKKGIVMEINQFGERFKGEEVVVIDMEYGFPQSRLCDKIGEKNQQQKG
ncbi:hypothetical protein [Chromobacterium violaceum]|uniref:hypothetical protein n=1 Tax=Chromobacterium violaceum TaxID=536 RepID=UPI001124D8B3|nr:hypothetical protein [Chromobacterium violaceum]